MDRDPWFEDYRRHRQRKLALMEAEAQPAQDAPADATWRCCPWCRVYGPMDVQRIGACEGPLHLAIRECRNCGRATSRLEDR